MDRQPLILPYEERRATCEKWDPRAPEVALHLAWLIERWLPDVEVAHIGSTAVPGCGGTGVIDLLVVYPPVRREAMHDMLTRFGFQRRNAHDRSGRDDLVYTGAIERDGAIFRIHAHAVAGDSPQVARVRVFRDRLRTDPMLRDAYVSHKKAVLRAGITDPLEYSARKADFIEGVLRDR